MEGLQENYFSRENFFSEQSEAFHSNKVKENTSANKSENRLVETNKNALFPTVTIIIPTYNDWDRLSICLDALDKQSYSKELYEIIVVNNNPDESAPEGFKQKKNVLLIHESKVGSYAARNTGLKLAKGEIIGFTDADCTPDKNWIENGINFLLKNENFMRVAGPVAIIQKGLKATVVEKYNQIYSFPQEWLIGNGGGSVTANLFVRRSVFDSVGGFDETVLSMGDKLWGMKAQVAGYPIGYAENVVVFHPARTLKELISKERRHGGAISGTLPSEPVKLYLRFLYECRPRLSGVRFMLGRRKDLRIIDRVTIPYLRHFLILVRIYESIKIRLGRKKPSRV